MLVALVLAAVSLAPQSRRPAPPVALPPPPQDLTLPPETANTVTILEGRGVQIYTCTAEAGSYRWIFKAPEAQLYNLATGKLAGHHDAGPNWTVDDGSSVRGTVATSKPGLTPADVPWLLLHAAPNIPGQANPQGELATVSYIRRYNTHGGAARPTGCDVAHVGQEQRIPYSATYAFYAVPGAPTNLQQPPPPPPQSPAQ